MATRADTISQTLKKVDTYSDFSTNFVKHPITNELMVVKNEDSIKQAFKNAILTDVFERFFNPFFGSNIRNTLFENFDPFTVEDIIRYVKLTAQQFESRIQIINVGVTDAPDQNAYAVQVVFSIINNPDPVVINLFLKRVR